MFVIAICEDEKYMLEKLSKKVDIDIALLDMMLPGINELEVAKLLFHKSQVIFITS